MLMPQFNPEHVVFIKQSLFLRAIFRFIPDKKKENNNNVQMEIIIYHIQT